MNSSYIKTDTPRANTLFTLSHHRFESIHPANGAEQAESRFSNWRL